MVLKTFIMVLFSWPVGYRKYSLQKRSRPCPDDTVLISKFIGRKLSHPTWMSGKVLDLQPAEFLYNS
jgi:hypothetical protein